MGKDVLVNIILAGRDGFTIYYKVQGLKRMSEKLHN